MAKNFSLRKVFCLMSAAGLIGLTGDVWAAAFQLWEQDGASVGEYHAGRVAEATDASTSFYNPAGLVRLPHQEFVLAADPVLTSIKFDGTVQVSSLSTKPLPATAQGGGYNTIPSAHYSTPLCKNLFFGFSVVVPFGLQTDYGDSTNASYSATLTSAQVVDFTPSLALALNDYISVGAGVDIERMHGDFDLVATAFDSVLNTQANNNGNSQAFGAHAGVLLQFNPNTRMGLAYQTKVSHRIIGDSVFQGPLANNGDGGTQSSSQFRLNMYLPATSSLSIYHTINSAWDVMGTVSYTQWSIVQDLIFQNVSGILGGLSSNALTVVIPQHLRNTWNYSVGGHYHMNEKLMFRAGVGFDQTPVKNQYRNLAMPDSDKIALAVGGHYQATEALGLDAGWTHLFVMNTRINNSQPVGDQMTVTQGTVQSSADVYGLQATWDFL